MSDILAGRPVATWGDLCLFLGGTADSFTGRLLELAAKAGPGDRERLRAGFPRQVAAWEIWRERPPGITFGELEEALAERMADRVRTLAEGR